MQAAHCAFLASKRMIYLRNIIINADLTKLISTIKSRQKTSVILYSLALHQHQTIQSQ